MSVSSTCHHYVLITGICYNLLGVLNIMYISRPRDVFGSRRKKCDLQIPLKR